MRRVIFNQKGGVGKSTITCNLAAISAHSGHRTLVIDMDPQCNATHYLLGDLPESSTNTLMDFFHSQLKFRRDVRSPEDCILKTPFKNLDIMPSDPELDDLQTKLESRYKMFKLRDALEELSSYSHIYIDTPPALNFYTRSALIAAHACLVPFDCDEFSRRALYLLLENVEEVRNDHNPNLKIEGIVINQYQSRAKLHRRIVEELRKDDMPVLDCFLSSSVKIRESHEQAMPMIHLDARHKLSQEFRELYDLLKNSAR